MDIWGYLYLHLEAIVDLPGEGSTLNLNFVKHSKPGRAIIVIRGYDQQNFLVNDPHGEWFPWGYDKRPKIGERLRYSKRATSACCDSFSQGEAMDRYARMSDTEMEAVNSIWLHRIHKE